MSLPPEVVEQRLALVVAGAGGSAVLSGLAGTIDHVPCHFRFELEEGCLEVGQPEPGGFWYVSRIAFSPERVTEGPWLSSDHPDMPSRGLEPFEVAEAIRAWWVGRRTLSDRLAA
jgi:hypothetical protein